MLLALKSHRHFTKIKLLTTSLLLVLVSNGTLATLKVSAITPDTQATKSTSINICGSPASSTCLKQIHDEQVQKAAKNSSTSTDSCTPKDDICLKKVAENKKDPYLVCANTTFANPNDYVLCLHKAEVKKNALAAKKAAANKRREAAKAKKVQVDLKKRGNDSAKNDLATTPRTPTTTATHVTSSPVISKVSKPQSESRGNIAVITYLNGPLAGGAKQSSDKAGRIGLVKIEISRKGGQESCTSHSNLSGLTNSAAFFKRPGGKTIQTEGTIHFASCRTGSYTVKNLGRNGYKVQGDSTISFNLADSETKKVHFTMIASGDTKNGTNGSSKTKITPTFTSAAITLDPTKSSKLLASGQVTYAIPATDPNAKKACSGIAKVTLLNGAVTYKTLASPLKWDDAKAVCNLTGTFQLTSSKVNLPVTVNISYPGNKYLNPIADTPSAPLIIPISSGQPGDTIKTIATFNNPSLSITVAKSTQVVTSGQVTYAIPASDPNAKKACSGNAIVTLLNGSTTFRTFSSPLKWDDTKTVCNLTGSYTLPTSKTDLQLAANISYPGNKYLNAIAQTPLSPITVPAKK
ncbi:MAG: hypothetical protein NVS1B10_01830 [Candidatus Saccharimonadales bacterium]